MDAAHIAAVRLLLEVMPDIFQSPLFAMKGGTAINLFVRELPRLSVDIDLVYVSREPKRATALADIARELDRLEGEWQARRLEVFRPRAGQEEESRILVGSGGAQLKVEVNHVFRGTVLPVVHRQVSPTTATLFTTDLAVPMLDPAELYGSKLVAALDRQHPRDWFDVMHLLASGSLDAGVVECFVIYLAGHNRPMHEVLAPREPDFRAQFESEFQGMTSAPVSLDELVAARRGLHRALAAALSQRHFAFLESVLELRPDASRLCCPHVLELPAVQWKLFDLAELQRRKPVIFSRQIERLHQAKDELQRLA